ncbi:uncharacterized protein B0I36DRAFT_272233 [Microdochium trichocladiopsis]|uniref:Uncharacterized protein n=1 Tax=Microdochium trichocladiopsis TaxID=1682393 RepID=A0A9P9BJL2_9PEZI|nr:uncharacterized protein B0I36DRAFT_272233 [Microdochium trichocladiopsis]KAH7025689.1 hypothetical protein B0I36DRAFT_272233 [Microdochium trichocladiopsis]
MDKIRKVVFDPLATSKEQIRQILLGFPVGTAHPFSADKILLCRTTETDVEEIDVSTFPEDYFYNAVDLGEMGEVLLQRMAGWPELGVFSEYQIIQAPASTFTVPIVEGQMSILAVSERKPTYYDLCLADPATSRTSCYSSKNTLKGVTHSGDRNHGANLLQHIVLWRPEGADDLELCVFISGFQYTKITRFLGTHPALMVADHDAKMLYLIPVPLDSATIGDATICCPLVIRRRGNELVCSILQKATTDNDKMCSGSSLKSPCFAEALERAVFEVEAAADPTSTDEAAEDQSRADETTAKAALPSDNGTENLTSAILSKSTAIIATTGTPVPAALLSDSTQLIRFGTGLEFELDDAAASPSTTSSEVVLPCVFGTQLEGPVLLATGTLPRNTQPLFPDSPSLRKYYSSLSQVVVVVDERMTDNARTLAGPWRINALFIVQSAPARGAAKQQQKQPQNADEVIEMLNGTNINAVTALAGPQSLVLVRLAGRYYFYRGLGNPEHFDTAKLAFGDDVTQAVTPLLEQLAAASKNDNNDNNKSDGDEQRVSLVHPLAPRILDTSDPSTLPIILPRAGKTIHASDLEPLFADASMDDIRALQEDIASAVPQLQLILGQKELQALGASLVATLSAKINTIVAPLRTAYLEFLRDEQKGQSDESSRRERQQKKAAMLGKLKKETLERQKVLGPAISAFASMVSARTTSKRTHDLKRLVRQSQIQGNVKATESMTFETLAELLETHASEMGVMLVNIEEDEYRELLGTLKDAKRVDASASCNLDSRVLHLDGFDAGILIEQSQNDHKGPLQRLSTSVTATRPTMALPFLNQEHGDDGSMLAWACWDEFVNLDSPYTTRWLDKCNEPHIAALRIITRETLGEAMISRDHNYGSGSSEIGTLMSALLMASMAKLAAMRTTAPTVVDKAEDTVTRLMRGLFGNLLTIAGSGLKPMSMVWQLFGLNPQYDVPSGEAEWAWYETVTALYPFTGWPLPQFHGNLEKLLDKVVLRVITKNEDTAGLKQNRLEEFVQCCKLRNVQLAHSRTIVTVLMRHMMATTKDDASRDETQNLPAIAERLLNHVPQSLAQQSGSYHRMISYLKHLAEGNPRNKHGDLILAGVYSKRSAAFADLKLEIAKACKAKDWQQARHAVKELMDKHGDIAAMWGLDANEMPLQNRQAYKDLLADSKEPDRDLYTRVVSDAERKRQPWQVGKKGQFGDDLVPLDESLVHKLLTGQQIEAITTEPDGPPGSIDTASTSAVEGKPKTVEEEFAELESAMVPAFLKAMQKPMTAEDVCHMLAVPVSTMRVIIQTLAPEQPELVWEELPLNYKRVMLSLVKDRSSRSESRPTRRLLQIGSGKQRALSGK